jgi:diguanylate cyclase (GGDEF)-like protein
MASKEYSVDDRAHSTGSLWHTLSARLFGTEPQQRSNVERFLRGALVYLACAVLTGYSVSNGLTPPWLAIALIAYMVSGVAVFYALLRSGWTARFKDPSIAVARSFFAVSAIVFGYAVVGPGRGAAMLLLALVLAFGLFTLTPRQIVTVGLCAVSALGVVMWIMTGVAPERFDPALELIHFGLAAVILPTLTAVAKQANELRQRMATQQRALAEALARVQKLARRDELTGLCNRRRMQELLGEAQRRDTRYGATFCLAVVDLDHFKRVNDVYGHAIGDEVLRNFAKEAATMLRDTDVMARWGGEEFLLLFPDTKCEQAAGVMQRLRGHFAGRSLSDRVPNLAMTFSAGLAEHRRGDGTRATIDRADQALYAAKAAGRDRVFVGAVDDISARREHAPLRLAATERGAGARFAVRR